MQSKTITSDVPVIISAAFLSNQSTVALLKKVLLLLVCVSLSVPIAIFQIGTLDIPLSVVTLPLGIMLFLAEKWSNEKIFFSISILLSLLSILITASVISDSFSATPILSLLYFFFLYFTYYIGKYLVRTTRDFKFTVSVVAYCSLFTSLAILFGIYRSDGIVRIEGILQGSILGLHLYGKYGVNTLAVYYATMFSIMLVYMFSDKKTHLFRIALFSTGLLASAYLLIFSISREAIVGAVFFMCIILFRKGIFSLLLVVAAIGALGYYFADEIGLVWATKMLTLESSSSGFDLDNASSGRFGILSIALNDLIASPFLGTSFHGFSLFNSDTLIKNVVEDNSSPHNQYITTFWKMGIFAAIFFFLFFYSTLKSTYLSQKMNRNMASGIWLLIVTYLVVFLNLWDVLLTPLLGMFFMFFVGALAGMGKPKQGARAIGDTQFQPKIL